VRDDRTARWDDDGDGWSENGGDCDDADPAVFPGADELVDGVDQDCDHFVDDETEIWDDDGDGWTEVAGDCDDGNPWVRPGASELVDGVDQDCDGVAELPVGWCAGGAGGAALLLLPLVALRGRRRARS